MPIFRIKSVKIYTGKKHLHRYTLGSRNKYQVCLRMNLDQVLAGRTCNKGWSYTRVIQYEFVGAANEEIRDVQSRFSHCFTLNFK